MKNLLLCCMLFMSISIMAQKADLPRKVVVTFDQKFPGVKDVKWKEQKGDYKIKFDFSGKKIQVEINENGKWKKTTTTMDFAEIPDKVQATINANKKKGEISSIKKVVSEGEAVEYKIEIKEGSSITKLKTDELGKILKSVVESKSGDE